jgi:DNA modification methylase
MEQPVENALHAKARSTRLNDLSGTEWVRATKSVMFQQGLGPDHPDARIERQHPAPFAFRDAERLVRLFSREGDRVLDPFAGIGSTMKACALAGRRGVGFELNPKFQRWAVERIKKEVDVALVRRAPQVIRQGDALRLARRLHADSVDFVFTSPPYWDILGRAKSNKHWQKGSRPYSADKRDLGCFENYDEFTSTLATFFVSLRSKLRAGRYMAVVVADFRRGARLVPFHADLIAAIEQAHSSDDVRRLTLQGIKIIAQNSKRLYPYGFPTTYVPNIHHNYVLIFRNIEKAPKKKKPINA